MLEMQLNSTPAATITPSASPSAGVASPSESMQELRRRRIEDFQRQAAAEPDPTEACIGAANGGLFNMGLELEQEIKNSLAQQPESLELVLRLIDAHLRVMRQTDRFTRLSIQMRNEAIKNR